VRARWESCQVVVPSFIEKVEAEAPPAPLGSSFRSRIYYEKSQLLVGTRVVGVLRVGESRDPSLLINARHCADYIPPREHTARNNDPSVSLT